MLRRKIVRSNSATAVLQEICSSRGASAIKARRIGSADQGHPPSWVRFALRASHAVPIQYRRVQLVCGAEVLSVADNWYLPSHLTPGMNEALLTTDTPFGAVVRPMGFRRRTLIARILNPKERMPHIQNCSNNCAATETFVLRHRAVLVDARERPFSVVEESYTAAALRP